MSTTRKASTTRTVRVERDAVGLREVAARPYLPTKAECQRELHKLGGGFERGDDVRTGPFPRQRATFVLEHDGEALLSRVVDGRTVWISAPVASLVPA